MDETHTYSPHEEGCCPCVDRLRAQNKASSDAWTERVAVIQSDLHSLRSLMDEAKRFHRGGDVGISMYGQAALAAALEIADAAEGKLEAVQTQMLRERRGRLAAEKERDELRRMRYRELIATCPRCGGARPAAKPDEEH